MRVALAQMNPVVGDVAGNGRRIAELVARAQDERVDLVIFPELAVLGYPPKDLLFRPDIIEANVEAVRHIAAKCTRTAALVGYAQPDPARTGQGVFNAAGLCRGGRLESWYAKMLLPQYDVFDEARYFSVGRSPHLIDLPGQGGAALRTSVTICEDIWNNEQFEGRQVYGVDPVELSAKAGAKWLANLSASPYRAGVEPQREALFATQLREFGLALQYANQVGGNDDLVFDGASMAMDSQGHVIARAKAFEEDFLIANLEEPSANRIEPQPEYLEGIHKAIVLGTRDYLAKCGFKHVVIGLSGGIDSAVVAALAVEALGAEFVHGVALPSRYSSPHSLEDAKSLAANLGIDLQVIPIETAHRSMEETMGEAFAGLPRDVTEENVQARIRGMILMAISNKFGWMLLSTGNKSEWAVGYCTLYGDMCGGLAMLGDVPKTRVYELAERINRRAGRELIPRRSISRAPSAELSENQTDQDVLPPYAVLDALLEQYIEQGRSPEQIVAAGFDRETVERVACMIRTSEHKRFQAPLALKVTSKAFGAGRRFPIAARYS